MVISEECFPSLLLCEPRLSNKTKEPVHNKLNIETGRNHEIFPLSGTVPQGKNNSVTSISRVSLFFSNKMPHFEIFSSLLT